jgi:hypothetical protein
VGGVLSGESGDPLVALKILSLARHRDVIVAELSGFALILPFQSVVAVMTATQRLRVMLAAQEIERNEDLRAKCAEIEVEASRTEDLERALKGMRIPEHRGCPHESDNFTRLTPTVENFDMRLSCEMKSRQTDTRSRSNP